MNPSTALSRVLVDELVRNGVTDVVLAPGSRNAPLSFALHAADATGRLRLHVRIDERTAGFLALGLAKVHGTPTAVACTSGTAAANLHPAVLEASHSGVPLLVLTADRPPELRGTGANQATDQVKLYGDAVRLFVDVGAPHDGVGQVPHWRALACRAVAHAVGEVSGDPGPVHLNLPLRDPLVPDTDEAWVESLQGRPDGAPWTRVDGPAWTTGWFVQGPDVLAGEARTLVVVGDTRGGSGLEASVLAARIGWPVVAEPSAGALGDAVLRCGSLLLADEAWMATHRPDRVLVVGHPTLSRAVAGLLRDPRVAVDVVTDVPRWVDPALQARSVVPADRLRLALMEPLTGEDVPIPVGPACPSPSSAGGRPSGARVDQAWAQAWRLADERAAEAVDAALLDAWPSGLMVAREVMAALPEGALLVLGSSTAVRDADLVAAPRPAVTVLANRGLAGIDGTVSTAVGAALRWQATAQAASGRHTPPAYAVIGDLTFLHDAGGLVIGRDEPRPDLCILVLNDDGGAIFGLLEQGRPEHSAAFERVFGTPHGVDLAALCAATATPYELVATVAQLRAALRPHPGVRVVEVRVDRHGARDLHARLRQAVGSALLPR